MAYSHPHSSLAVDENSLIYQDTATAKTAPANAFLKLVLVIFLLPFRIYIINNQYANFLANRLRQFPSTARSSHACGVFSSTLIFSCRRKQSDLPGYRYGQNRPSKRVSEACPRNFFASISDIHHKQSVRKFSSESPPAVSQYSSIFTRVWRILVHTHL